MDEKVWESVEDLFTTMNEQSNYVVLRNYEQFPESLTIKGHEDIDLLCDNSKQMVKIMGAKAVGKSNVHYIIKIGERIIPVDIRHVGDGYYDTRWELNMLKRRNLYKNLYYVLDDEDYFYSLLYHAMIQKPFMAGVYIRRLVLLRDQISINLDPETDFPDMLDVFLRNNEYKVSNTEDPQVFLNFEKISPDLIHKNIRWSIKRNCFQYKRTIQDVNKKMKRKILETLSKIKRWMIRLL